MISGHHFRGKRLRCFHTLTALGSTPTALAKTAAPPLALIMSDADFIPDRLPDVTRLHNHKSTHGNVTARNLRGMVGQDDSWKRLRGTWDRLRWARTRAGFERAKDFADSIGVKPGTYNQYEREPGASRWAALDHQKAIRYGKKLKVSWEWLLTGLGEPWLTLDTESPKGIVLRDFERLDEDQQSAIAEMIARLAKTGTNG